MLTLSNIPSDIISEIVRVDEGQSVDTMMLISPTWNILVKRYLGSLPPIKHIAFYERTKVIRIELFANHNIDHLLRSAIEPIVPSYSIAVKRVDNTTQIAFALSFGTPFTSLQNCLLKIFLLTTEIEILSFLDFNADSLRIVRKTMRKVNIGKMDLINVRCDFNMRTTLKDMMLRHGIRDIGLIADKFDYVDLCESIQLLSDPPVDVFYIEEVDRLGVLLQYNKTSWEAVAKWLIFSKSVKFVSFISSGNPIIRVRLSEPDPVGLP